MSTSRLLSLLGSSIYRTNHPLSATILSSTTRFWAFKHPPSSPSLRLHRCCSSAAVIEDNAAIGSPESQEKPAYHPWPEWVSFVDKLKARGYVSAAKEKPADGAVYTDMNLLKDPCLQFARNRYDIISSLCRLEMQTLVGKGCPNLLRKAVNSAKRLRAYLGIEEGEVCKACALRGSCDRANLVLSESESVARTVDVVRLLLLYALDPIATDGGTKYEDRELVEVSARNLLSEMTELSDKIPAPKPPEPAVINLKKKYISFVKGAGTSDVELKRGDWVCSKCTFMNFARNAKCRECGEYGPTMISSGDLEMKKGDWICPECEFMNFARNRICKKCTGPGKPAISEVVMKKGDWNCPKCTFTNFARNAKCRECGEYGPTMISWMKKGDWICPECEFMNFARNTICKKCTGPDKPAISEVVIKKGDWNCPKCNFINSASNIKCLRCRDERPKRELKSLVTGNAHRAFS